MELDKILRIAIEKYPIGTTVRSAFNPKLEYLITSKPKKYRMVHKNAIVSKNPQGGEFFLYYHGEWAKIVSLSENTLYKIFN